MEVALVVGDAPGTGVEFRLSCLYDISISRVGSGSEARLDWINFTGERERGKKEVKDSNTYPRRHPMPVHQNPRRYSGEPLRTRRMDPQGLLDNSLQVRQLLGCNRADVLVGSEVAADLVSELVVRLLLFQEVEGYSGQEGGYGLAAGDSRNTTD